MGGDGIRKQKKKKKKKEEEEKSKENSMFLCTNIIKIATQQKLILQNTKREIGEEREREREREREI